jgi:hypothetical protein
MIENTLLPKNLALEPLSVLIGKWNVEMTHVQLPKPLVWQDSLEWLENAFILWHWQGKNEVPQGTFIIGRNENKSGNMYNIFYYDSRGISRFFEMSFENRVWKFSRKGADFYQRTEYTISEDGNSIVGHGEMSHDEGKEWKHDFSITYTKQK